MKKATLPNLRLAEETVSNMKAAIEKHNENSILNLTVQEFRRLSIELLSQSILQDRKDILSLISISD